MPAGRKFLPLRLCSVTELRDLALFEAVVECFALLRAKLLPQIRNHQLQSCLVRGGLPNSATSCQVARPSSRASARAMTHACCCCSMPVHAYRHACRFMHTGPSGHARSTSSSSRMHACRIMERARSAQGVNLHVTLPRHDK